MYVGYLPTVGGKVRGKKDNENGGGGGCDEEREKQTDFYKSLLEPSHLIPPISFRESIEIRMVPTSNLKYHSILCHEVMLQAVVWE